MASDVHARTVNDLLSLAYLTGTKDEISISVRLQATKDRDAMYVDYCPTSATPGQGSITVTPHFFGPSGVELTSMAVKTSNALPLKEESGSLSSGARRKRLVARLPRVEPMKETPTWRWSGHLALGQYRAAPAAD